MPIYVEGLDQLRRALRRVKDKELDDELKAIHQDFAATITDAASPNVRVRTGRLRGTLRSSGTKRDAIGRLGSSSVPYAAVIHWKYGPPALTDAAAQIERNHVDRYDQRIAGMLDRVIGR